MAIYTKRAKALYQSLSKTNAGFKPSRAVPTSGGRSAIGEAKRKMDETIAKETPEQRKAREKKIRDRNMGYPEYPS